MTGTSRLPDGDIGRFRKKFPGLATFRFEAREEGAEGNIFPHLSEIGRPGRLGERKGRPGQEGQKKEVPMKPFIVLSLFLPACIIHSSARAQPQNDNTIVLTSPRNRVPEARRNEKPRPFIPPKDIVRTDPMLEEDIESLLQAYPQCREGYVNYCLDGEIRIPCTNLCWYRCRGGETWRDGACHREKSICNAYQNCVVDARYANKRCQEHHPDYRMPNIDEFLYLLHECRINTSNIRGDEWCPAFHRGNLKYVMNLKGLQYISLWLNQGYITEDGTMTYSWMARGSLTKNEKIQLFVIGSYAVAQTACVREQADF